MTGVDVFCLSCETPVPPRPLLQGSVCGEGGVIPISTLCMNSRLSDVSVLDVLPEVECFSSSFVKKSRRLTGRPHCCDVLGRHCKNNEILRY